MTARHPAPGPFHPGELAVQARAGVRAQAARVGGIVAPAVPDAFATFLRAARVAAVGATDAEGRVWATLLVGAPGVVDAAPTRVHVRALPASGDALRARLAGGADGASPAPVGLTVIDFPTRRRVRINGPLAPADHDAKGGFAVAVEEAYGNCPKYIQDRTPPAGPGPPGGPAVSLTDVAAGLTVCATDELGDAQQRWLAAADTAFVASLGPAGAAGGPRADASHRGGAPGFLAVDGPRRLRLPDYAGNTMFNTLGNLAADPRVGLVVPDFATGRLLQLSGTAAVDWRPAAAAAFPGAERVVVVDVARVREVAGALPAGWSPPRPSPFNPPAPRGPVDR